MISLNFNWTFYYKTLGVTPDYRPIIIPVLKRTEKSTQEIDVPAIVDTGADFSIFQGNYATAIGITIRNGRPENINVFGGWFQVYMHQVILIIENHVFPTEIGFPDQPIPRNILGRNFLKLVKLGVDEKIDEFYLTPNI